MIERNSRLTIPLLPAKFLFSGKYQAQFKAAGEKLVVCSDVQPLFETWLGFHVSYCSNKKVWEDYCPSTFGPELL